MNILFSSKYYTPLTGNSQANQEATQNKKMTLIVDVDINLLKALHEHGSNTMKDRQT
jgi:hypothetical protein